MALFVFSSRRRHTRFDCDWSSDVCSSDLTATAQFDSLNDAVAAVTPSGLVTAKARGETHVMIRFCGQASVFQVTLPYGKIRSEERRVGKECRSRWSPYH